MGLVPKKYSGTDGKITKEESQFLFETAERVGPGWYVDLGTYKGRSACSLAAGIRESGKPGAVLSIDRHQKELATKNLKERELLDIVTLVEGDTARTAADYQGKRFNFIFIDANHHYNKVKTDFECWSPLLTPDGEIAFHDSFTHSEGAGVYTFLEELPDLGWTQQGTVGTITWWKRKEN